MAKKRQELDGGGNWMDTYGDMVTLLMTFFIAMYSMSTIQEDKWAELVKAFNIHGTEKVDQIVFTVENDGDDLVDNSGDSNGYNPGDANDDSDDVDFSDLYNYLKEHIEKKQYG
jgi:chemotaxis protein MotB